MTYTVSGVALLKPNQSHFTSTCLSGLRSSTQAGEQQSCLVCVELRSVGGHPVADVKDSALELIGG